LKIGKFIRTRHFRSACGYSVNEQTGPAPTPVVPGFAAPTTWLALWDSYIIGQGLHPSGIDYKRWAEQLSVMIQKVLN
jgi:hypothetical protein